MSFVENPNDLMRVKPHRGTLSESMNEVRVITRTKAALVELINSDYGSWMPPVGESDIEITKYGWDSRIDWDCYIVTYKVGGVWGMLDNNPY